MARVHDLGVDTYELNVGWESLTSAEKTNLESFYHGTVDGMTQTWTYTDEGGTAYTARFIEPDLSFKKYGQNVFDIDLRLELSAMPA